MPDKTFKREQVVEILGSVLTRVSATHPLDSSLMTEVRQLQDAIDNMRRDLNLAHPDQIQSHIPTATDELDAIVATTENATNSIMEACESIQKHIGETPVNVPAVESEIIRIIEACTFQDLTGQRISKIIKSLSEIEKRARELTDVLSERFANLENQGEKPVSGDSLMNGPALPNQGITQDEIDRLLNDF